jgi:hypothetical protein
MGCGLDGFTGLEAQAGVSFTGECRQGKISDKVSEIFSVGVM